MGHLGWLYKLNLHPRHQHCTDEAQKAETVLSAVDHVKWCLIQNVVYQATVESAMGKETYIGFTANQFKTRFRNHTASFRNKNKRNVTELSKHIWSLKDSKTEFAITWKVLSPARPYSNVTKRCNLCITEKFFIICKPGAGTLNKRNELASACRHATKYLIRNA